MMADHNFRQRSRHPRLSHRHWHHQTVAATLQLRVFCSGNPSSGWVCGCDDRAPWVSVGTVGVISELTQEFCDNAA